MRAFRAGFRRSTIFMSRVGRMPWSMHAVHSSLIPWDNIHVASVWGFVCCARGRESGRCRVDVTQE